MLLEEYPKDYFVKLEGDEHRVGRLVLNKVKDEFHVEIDIVQKESKKIYIHVDIIYNCRAADEALDLGVQRLANFLSDSVK